MPATRAPPRPAAMSCRPCFLRLRRSPHRRPRREQPVPELVVHRGAGNSFQCELTSGATTISGWAPCTSPKNYDLTGQPDGTYTFSVTQTDPASNVSPAATGNYTLSTAPPSPPTITSSPASPGNGRSPSWSFTGVAGNSFQCELTSGSTTISGWAPCTSPQAYDLTGQPDGTYTFSVTQTDPVGNTSTAAASTYTLSTAPVIVSITSAPESPGNSRAPSWSFTVEAGTTTECELTSGSTTIAGWAPCTSPQSYDLTVSPTATTHSPFRPRTRRATKARPRARMRWTRRLRVRRLSPIALARSARTRRPRGRSRATRVRRSIASSSARPRSWRTGPPAPAPAHTSSNQAAITPSSSPRPTRQATPAPLPPAATRCRHLRRRHGSTARPAPRAPTATRHGDSPTRPGTTSSAVLREARARSMGARPAPARRPTS